MNSRFCTMLGDVHTGDFFGVKVRRCCSANACEPTIDGKRATIGLP